MRKLLLAAALLIVLASDGTNTTQTKTVENLVQTQSAEYVIHLFTEATGIQQLADQSQDTREGQAHSRDDLK